ncbi:SulP family inorganic anion transporter [Alphaproteobacteria bacterium]|nr:SulP family inorganic anion transporter [Alphaproteobacteria bacterium]MDA8643259.1 SulP family inorganic anion transporter [Alphaproteobacteria bacterium]MDA8666954.1 SulP family inorganic anion transporter [Alphaproteobacteria bacterium]MDA8779775.1 SulP family inorganic anion transporter [Alphaproteobacteria bacterium]MDA9590418.1 SulP family inorganic anion transporter [Alphaproteobacteria bacterium]
MSFISKAARSDFGSGIAIALLSLTYALSYGALLFTSPLLIPYIGYAISAALITTVVTGLAIAYLSGIKFSIAGPDSNSVAVMASLFVLVAQSLNDSGLGGETLALATLTIMMVITLLTALTMFLLGYFQIGNFIRFVPISVAGGFLAAAGCLMVSGAILLATGIDPMNPLNFEAVTDLQKIKLLTVCGLAVVYWYVSTYIKNSLALPLTIFASIFIIHGIFALQGMSIAEAQKLGLLLEVSGDTKLFIPATQSVFDKLTLATLFEFLPETIAVIVVVGLAILLIIAGIELERNFDSDLNHELKIHGYAIGLSGIFGGFSGLVSLSRSLLNVEKKSRFPIAAVLTTILCGGVFMVGADAIALLPQISLAAMVLFLGTQIAFRWMITTFNTLDRLEYMMILVIAGTTLYAGFIFGLGLGVVAGCILFAARASIISIVRSQLSGEAYRSRVVRSPDEEAYLDGAHKTIRIYELQGFLFFGTAHNFYTLIKEQLEDTDDEVRHLILSFRHVSGIDASAEQILQKIFYAADKHNCSVSTIELPKRDQIRVARLLHRSPALIADQNYAAIYDAMEAIEESMLRERAFDAIGSLQRWLELRFDDIETAEKLFDILQPEEYVDGQVICHQGEDADEIYFLDRGRVDVVSHDMPGQAFRIYSYMRHTMLGEMGFVRRETRSADLVARGTTVIYTLSRETYQKLEKARDPSVDALLHLISVTLSDRIISANRTIGELQS